MSSKPGEGVLLGIGTSLFYGLSILVVNLVQTLSLLVLPFSRKAFRAINRFCADTWWGWLVFGAHKIFPIDVVVTGDEIPEKENAIVIANHQQMPDILMIMILARPKGRLGDLKWFVKDSLKYVPGIGWGMLFLDCLFVKRDWTADKNRIRATFSKFIEHGIPIWLVTFVEGTRITPAKLARSQEYCRRKSWPIPANVLVPKTRGFTAAVEGLGSHIQAVYDVTIGYEEGVPGISEVLRGLVKRVHIDVKRFPISDLSTEERELAAWLRARFERKDAILGELYRTGRFPA